MQKIVLGCATWAQNPFDVGQPILARARPLSLDLNKGQGMKAKIVGIGSPRPKAWFCALYNQNKCMLPSPHEATDRGKQVQVEHICAACLMKDGTKSFHSEAANVCPLFKA